MRWLPLCLPLVVLVCLWVGQVNANNHHGAVVDDNDFAEFEDFDDEEMIEDTASKEQPREPPRRQEPKVVMSPEADLNEAEMADDDDAMVEDEDYDYDHLNDDEEFEGFDPESSHKGKGAADKPPDLEIATVPLHLRTNWDSFYMEMLMLAGLGVYFLNFLAGKSKNHRLAQAWLNAHRNLLESNFSLVGDDGTSAEVTSTGGLLKESENLYSLWCSGRVCCEGMLVTLKLLKRQDLVSTMSRWFRPAADQIVVKVELDESDMDTFVMCLANKKVCSKMQKDLNDLSWYCPDKRRVDNYQLPQSFQVLSEIPEATSMLFDTPFVKCVSKYEDMVEYIHVSDQFCGPRNQDDPPTKMPETSKVLIFCFNTPNKGKCSPKDMENMTELMKLVFHCMDRVKRIRLTGIAKQKAEKNRQRVSESFSKASHAQRAEAAQARKEEKMRAEKERIMKEDDPEKQKRLEEKHAKKEAKKKKQTKMKMMKVKAA